MQLVHVMHRFSVLPKPHERIDLFFDAKKWKGEIKNAEPEKCSELRWAKISELPKNIIPEVRQALEKISEGEHYSEFNF